MQAALRRAWFPFSTAETQTKDRGYPEEAITISHLRETDSVRRCAQPYPSARRMDGAKKAWVGQSSVARNNSNRQ